MKNKLHVNNTIIIEWNLTRMKYLCRFNILRKEKNVTKNRGEDS